MLHPNAKTPAVEHVCALRGHKPPKPPDVWPARDHGRFEALFNGLSPDVARALASQLTAGQTTPRARNVSELYALSAACRVAMRSEVLSVARQRFRLTRPNWTALLPHWSTSDVLVRLYLESRDTFVAAQRGLLLFSQGELELRRGSYVAEVVPSLDRKASMQQAMSGLLQETSTSRSCVVRDFSGEHELAMFAGHSASCARPEAMNGRQGAPRRYRLALIFHYETGTILLKAASQRERNQLCQQFASIFARDPTYFDRPLSRLRRGTNRQHLLCKTSGAL